MRKFEEVVPWIGQLLRQVSVRSANTGLSSSGVLRRPSAETGDAEVLVVPSAGKGGSKVEYGAVVAIEFRMPPKDVAIPARWLTERI